MRWWKSKKILEIKIETYIKTAYKEWEYIRFYNLMTLLSKVNPTNKILLKYINKISEEKKEKYLKRWNKWFYFMDIIKSPELYILIFIWYIFGYTK